MPVKRAEGPKLHVCFCCPPILIPSQTFYIQAPHRPENHILYDKFMSKSQLHFPSQTRPCGSVYLGIDVCVCVGGWVGGGGVEVKWIFFAADVAAIYPTPVTCLATATKEIGGTERNTSPNFPYLP